MTEPAPGTPVPGPDRTRPIVVGTDGSDHARRAVLFALHEAQLRGVPVRAVCAYDFTPDRYTAYGWMAIPNPASDVYTHMRDTALDDVGKTVEELRREVGGPEVEVEIVAQQGRPAEVLLEEAKHAGLLVVGSRGSGLWGRLTLGSTSTEVVHHAHIPVVVVPAKGEEGGKG
ncbi:universal stress protein [Streptomyces armeniacus]|uniref:Universal stress protein n=1 Tax=Streptomyces armeniacus TaxID=83291 RepID=A0A345XPL8_9ACTN|nr:universal stress protein [Streptomyces armeniacus]AXK33584.1 universal stress protein [Streptomyces armeniacus]